jgi:hypothetical protein
MAHGPRKARPSRLVDSHWVCVLIAGGSMVLVGCSSHVAPRTDVPEPASSPPLTQSPAGFVASWTVPSGGASRLARSCRTVAGVEERVAHGLGLAIGIALVVGLTSVACSVTTTRVRAGATATAPTASLAGPTTVPMTLPTGPTTALDVTSTTDVSPVTTLLTEAPSTTIPPEPTDAKAAAAAIRDAYATLINVNATPSQLQNSVQAQNPAGLGTWQQAKNLMTGASVVVYSVRFTSAVAAVVVFQFFYEGGISPIFPRPLDGGAVYAKGHWQIDTVTACGLAVGAGYSCPGYSAQSPTTDTVPPDVTVPTNAPGTVTEGHASSGG